MSALILQPEAPPPVRLINPKQIGRSVAGTWKHATAKTWATAKLGAYQAAYSSATTFTGTRIGTNLNTSLARIQMASMQWTAADLQRNAPLAMAYLRVRANYCRPTRWKPTTNDPGLNAAIREYVHAKWKTMGVGCSMQAAVARTLHIETPIRGDAGLIIWRDRMGNLRLIEFSADQLGEVYGFFPPKRCSLTRDKDGNIRECAGNDLMYFAGRYFKDADCVAYKIYERQEHWYANPKIYAAQDVIYTVDPFNFRSHRGLTIFHNVMGCLQKGEDMLQAGLSAAQRQARTAMVVLNNSGGAMSQYDSIVDPNTGRVQYVSFDPGGGPNTEFGYNGDTIENMSADSPGPELIAGVQEADQRFCIGLGMTYAFVIACDRLGGAPSRLDANRSSNEIERIREDLSNPVFNRIAEITILDGVRNGDLPSAPGITSGSMSYVNLPTADAFRDSMDDIKSVRAGQDSDTRVLSRYGTTPEEVIRDKEHETFLAYQSLARVKQRLADAGIKEQPSIADIRQISDNPQQTAQADQLEQGKPTTISDSNTKSATVEKPATAIMAEWDESKHPRGNKDNAGEFGPGGGGAKTATVEKPKAKVSEPVEKSSGAKLTATKERAWNGKTVETKTKLSKLETGAIGEKAVTQWLKDQGFSDARPYDTSRNNAPIDLLQDHELYEVKTGLVSNGDTAQHWRATIGQPSPAETAWLKTASKEEKKNFNLAKSHAIEQRKADELAEYSKRTGRKAKGKMICTHLNPDTKTIDIYEFDGFKLRIPWNSPDLQKAYRGSYKYA
jgi:hypothetical protein